MSGVADERLLSVDVRTEVAEADGASTVLATASATLGTTSAGVVGLWEAGPGTDTDVEIDEVFLVLTGSGTVTFDDGRSIVLRPGVLVRLVAGDRTTWHVTERLRKLYLT